MQNELNWYYERGERQIGPVTFDELKEKFLTQKLPLQTRIWNAKLPNWVEAASIEDFKKLISSMPQMPKSTKKLVFSKLQVANGGENVLLDAVSLHFSDDYTPNIATFRERAIAFSIDAAVLAVVSSLLFLLDIPILSTLKRDSLALSVPILSFMLMILGWFYFVFPEYLGQASIGKRLMKLKIVHELGHQASFEQLTGRYFVKIFSFLILGIGCLMMLKSRKGKTLHDTWAGTLVKSKSRR